MKKAKLKIVSIVGTRPNFIKEFVFHNACKGKPIEKILIHTGQHYDYIMSEVFFKELAIPRPNYINQILKGTHTQETASMMLFIEDVLREEKPGCTVIYGDVNSTIAGALVSAKLRIPVVHIEAGLRSNSMYNPEEINRKVADSVSDLLFPHIREAYDSLLKEGYPPEKVILPGDITFDSYRVIMEQEKITPHRGDYLVLTLHREENTDNRERLTGIIRAIIKTQRRVVFPAHPRAMKSLKKYGLLEEINNAGTIELIEPKSYVQFLALMAGADKVLTDSGGVRREAYMMGKPVIVLINIVWVKAILQAGWKYIADADEEKIIHGIEKFEPPAERPEIFGDGHAAERIVEAILQRYWSY